METSYLNRLKLPFNSMFHCLSMVQVPGATNSLFLTTPFITISPISSTLLVFTTAFQY